MTLASRIVNIKVVVYIVVFVPVVGAVTAVRRDLLVLASNTQWPEIQPLKSQDQIVSADLPLWTDR